MILNEIGSDELIVQGKIGKGSFATVYRGLWGEKSVAIKELESDGIEAQILSQLSHRNIVQFYGIWRGLDGQSYSLISELCDNGSLFQMLHSDTTIYYLQILHWARDIATGMNYLHHEAPEVFIHRDLKSKNVVVDSAWTCKLCDFGSSRYHDRTMAPSAVAGTYPWMSPEMIKEDPISSACDVWSYGVVLWELLMREIPFKDYTMVNIQYAVVVHKERLPIPTTCPGPFSTLMVACWDFNPRNRPNFKSILTELDKMLYSETLSDETNLFLTDRPAWREQLALELARLKARETDIAQRETRIEQQATRQAAFGLYLDELHRGAHSVSRGDSGFDQPSLLDDVTHWPVCRVTQWFVQTLAAHDDRTAGDVAEKHAALFDENHINGRKLLELEMDDLRSMGVAAHGHRDFILKEVEHLRFTANQLVHFPPLKPIVTLRPESISTLSTSPAAEDSIDLVTLVGMHCVRFSERDNHATSDAALVPTSDDIGPGCQWKAYAVFVVDDDTIVADSLVNRVIFHRDSVSYRVSHPPFVMRAWTRDAGASEDVFTATVYFSKEKVLNPSQLTLTCAIKEPTQRRHRITVLRSSPGAAKRGTSLTFTIFQSKAPATVWRGGGAEARPLTFDIPSTRRDSMDSITDTGASGITKSHSSQAVWSSIVATPPPPPPLSNSHSSSNLSGGTRGSVRPQRPRSGGFSPQYTPSRVSGSPTGGQYSPRGSNSPRGSVTEVRKSPLTCNTNSGRSSSGTSLTKTTPWRYPQPTNDGKLSPNVTSQISIQIGSSRGSSVCGDDEPGPTALRPSTLPRRIDTQFSETDSATPTNAWVLETNSALFSSENPRGQSHTSANTKRPETGKFSRKPKAPVVSERIWGAPTTPDAYTKPTSKAAIPHVLNNSIILEGVRKLAITDSDETSSLSPRSDAPSSGAPLNGSTANGLLSAPNALEKKKRRKKAKKVPATDDWVKIEKKKPSGPMKEVVGMGLVPTSRLTASKR